MRWRGSMNLPFGMFVTGVLVAAGCTQVAPEDLEIPGPTSTMVDLSGDIAIGGDAPAVLVAADGTGIIEMPDNADLQQPTWSRDGRRLVAIDADPGGSRLYVLDRVEGSESFVDARRGYFFLSWSDDGSAIAALGPGPTGTSLDVLGPDGELLSEDSLEAGSFYLAWEPGGDDLLIHRDARLELVRDLTDLDDREPLGTPGQSFLAPAWIPGTRDALIIADQGAGPRLIRIDVDTAVEQDLGPVAGSAGIVVSPDGSTALLAHGMSGQGAEIEIRLPVQDPIAPTELVDLASGARSVVSARPTFWAEWSPDGEKIALLHASTPAGVEWAIWDGETTETLGAWLPTPVLLRNYLFFSWQFVESPRVWSPAGDALVYAGIDAAGLSGIFVHALGGEAVRISDGDVAFWSPR